MKGLWGAYAKWSKSNKDKHCITSGIYGIQTKTKIKTKLIDSESRLVVTKTAGGGEGGGVNCYAFLA